MILVSVGLFLLAIAFVIFGATTTQDRGWRIIATSALLAGWVTVVVGEVILLSGLTEQENAHKNAHKKAVETASKAGVVVDNAGTLTLSFDQDGCATATVADGEMGRSIKRCPNSNKPPTDPILYEID